MNENGSLFLLANVATYNYPNAHHNSHNTIRRKETKIKMLNVNHLNGELHSEINDLKSLPIGIIFELFVDKVEDKNLRCVAYVCKFGMQSHSCNTKFIFNNEKKIHASEHLVRCHLLEHLTKIKSGVMIKLPKKSVPNLDINYIEQSNADLTPKQIGISEMERIFNNVTVEPISTAMKRKLQTGASLIPDEAKKMKNAVNNSKSYFEETSLKNNVVVERGTILEHTYSAEMNSNNGTEKRRNTNVVLESSIDSIFDHSYTTRSAASIALHQKCISARYLSQIDVNNLYYLNSELSNELYNFMNFETLYHPANIFTLERKKELLIEQLPVVGSEVEISTDMDYSADSFQATKLNDRNDKTYRCPKCFKMFYLETSLHTHFRGDCSIPRKIKSKNTIKNIRISSEENKPVNTMIPLQDKNNNNQIFFQAVKENSTTMDDLTRRRHNTNILKRALLKDSNVKKPIISISNIWSNINVQYV